jgi:protein involved in polysaccharide export with SLBB domain
MTAPFRPALGFVLVLCAVVPAAFAAAPPAGGGDGKDVNDINRPLRVGDPVSVSIRDLEGPGKNTVVDVNVNEAGQIALPMLRKPLPATGLTTDKLREAIAQAYRQANLIQNARVTVKLRPGNVNDARDLRVGDALVVTIADLEGPGKSTMVKADVDAKGEITLPMLSKPVPARGLTREKLTDAIVKAYDRDNLIANAVVTVKFRNAGKNEPAAPKE